MRMKHEFSAPITSQQNGVVKRKNRVRVEMARVMLNSENIAQHFWAEAVNTTCYISNGVFLRSGTKQTPCELWTGKKPNVTRSIIESINVNVDDFAASTETTLDEDDLLSPKLKGESSGLDLVVDLSTFGNLVDLSTPDNSIPIDPSTCHNQPQNPCSSVLVDSSRAARSPLTQTKCHYWPSESGSEN
ncbi:unnamed protein product [Prunus armeniaca]